MPLLGRVVKEEYSINGEALLTIAVKPDDRAATARIGIGSEITFTVPHFVDMKVPREGKNTDAVEELVEVKA
jgi:hypothetical protein